MKTRAKKGTTSNSTKEQPAPAKIEVQQLEPSISKPPKVFILPEDTSPEARIITITSNRYLVCPQKGFFGFTRISAPKRECKSWLLAPDRTEDEQNDEGYVLQSPEMMVATPIDPLFIVLPALLPDTSEMGSMQMFLSPSDYIDKLEQQSLQLREMLRHDRQTDSRLDAMLERRIVAVCEQMEAGEQKLYKLSHKKLREILVEKARKMVEKGLPASMEERFVKQALVIPMLSVRREESNNESQSTDASGDTALSASTAATFVDPSTSDQGASQEIEHLLRLRTALDFLLRSYVPGSIHQSLNSFPKSKGPDINFTPLTAHLSHIEKLKKEAQALRTLSENISRKRGMEDDEEALEKAEAKKRKKEEEEEFRKKNTSRGVQQLKKADVSGMKKLSAFFNKKPAGKG